MTSNKEDYLKIIYEEGGLQKAVANKVIAEKLGIAAASVSEMLTKLEKQGLVHYQPYKGAKLTDEGLSMVIDVVRSHRLWEVFLIRHLGYTWREAHEDAHLLEHATPKRMIDRLDMFLNHPQTCPHGSKIPQNSDADQAFMLQPLSALSVGDRAIVRKISEDGALLDYLEKNGLKIGKEIIVEDVDEYEGPISFMQNGHSISVSHKAARQVYVELQD